MTTDFEVCQAGELARIRAQRDALAESLREMLDTSHVCGEDCDINKPCPIGEKARAALAALEAGKGPL